ncbi:MAG: trigger factor [Johnsonella sp.]|nr:trigger factor [Johnsonella sp.]
MRVKKIIIAAIAVFCLGSMAACSTAKKETQSSTEDTKSSESKESESTEESASAQSEAPEVEKGTAKLGNYKGLKVDMVSSEVSEEEVEDTIKNNLTYNPDITEVKDRAAENGDIVNINFAGKLDGVAFEGGTAENYDLELGSGSFIPGFEEQLIGAKIGESKEVNVTFPEEYHEQSLAGKPVVFEVKINAIKVSKPAKLTDEWVQNTTKENPQGQLQTVKEYREFVRKQLEETREAQTRSEAQSRLFDQVMQSSTFELNEEAVEEEYQTMLSYYTQMGGQLGVGIEEFASMNGMSKEEFEGEIRKGAEQSIKAELIVETIFASENLKIEDADYEKLAVGSGMTAAQLRLQYGEEADRFAKQNKVGDFLLENAKVTMIEAEELEAASESESESR